MNVPRFLGRQARNVDDVRAWQQTAATIGHSLMLLDLGTLAELRAGLSAMNSTNPAACGCREALVTFLAAYYSEQYAAAEERARTGPTAIKA